jgi:hypothetical protein
MAALIVLFNLKDKASKEAYEQWAKETDVPTVKGLSSVQDFKVYALHQLMGTGAPPPYAYVEVIDIQDMDQLGKDISTERMQEVAAQFQSFADNPLFIVGSQIA